MPWYCEEHAKEEQRTALAQCKANSDAHGLVAITRGRVRRAVEQEGHVCDICKTPIEARRVAFLLDYFETAFLPAGYAKDYFEEPFETRLPARKA